MKLNEYGLSIVKEFEGLSLKAYKPFAHEKHFTIGYGHYSSDITEDQTISESEAEDLLIKDLSTINDYVEDNFSFLDSNQHSAVVSLIFNVGQGNFENSKAYGHLNNGDFDEFCYEAFDARAGFVRAGGIIRNGLVRRRASEEDLFNGKI